MNARLLHTLSSRLALLLRREWLGTVRRYRRYMLLVRLVPPALWDELYLAWLKPYLRAFIAVRAYIYPLAALRRSRRQFMEDLAILDELLKEEAPDIDENLIRRVMLEFRSKVWLEVRPKEEFERLFRDAVLEGIGADELAGRIELAADHAFPFWKALRIARTELMRFYNLQQISGWMQELAALEPDDPLRAEIAGFRYGVVQDERTSDYCKPLADVYVPADQVRRLLLPPFHPNCRTILVPVFHNDLAPGEHLAQLRPVAVDSLPLETPREWQLRTVGDFVQ